MGYASMLESILDRYYAGRAGSSTEDQVEPPREAIDTLFAAYEHLPERERRLRDMAGSFLGRVEALVNTLKAVEAPLSPDEPMRAVWERLETARQKLLEHFADPKAIPLSFPQDHSALNQTLSSWRARAGRLRTDVRPVIASLAPSERQRLEQISSQIEADIDRYVRKAKELEGRLTKAWDAFRQYHRNILSLIRRRPTLQHLDPWLLDDQQLTLVEHQFSGVMALHGTSGSGKTVVLLHRALREAHRFPEVRVLLLARQEPLVHRLREAAIALSGGHAPSNLRIHTLYELWATVVDQFTKEGHQHRLRDGTRRGATERTSPDEPDEQLNSWLQFVRHTPTSPFKHDREVGRLRQNLVERLPRSSFNDRYHNADRYLYEEVSYIRSAFQRTVLPAAYLEMNREGRSIAFPESQRQVCLRILEGWNEWLRVGHVADVVGLTWRAADLVLSEDTREQCRTAAGADRILVDELQDVSTLELCMIRSLGPRSDDAPSAFYFAGDLEQKGSYLHLDHRMAGFNFRGKVRHLRRNYRNTREILIAAYAIVSDPAIRQSIRKDPDLEIREPELSVFSGAVPVVIPCEHDDEQGQVIVKFVEERRALPELPAVAIVSENSRTLERLETEFKRAGMVTTRVWGTDDRDNYLSRPDVARADRVLLGGFDSVRGLEFDTLIVADLSEEWLPGFNAEPWRNAARLYSTLTRARDELIITLVDKPSRFLSMMDAGVEWIVVPVANKISRVLDLLRPRS